MKTVKQHCSVGAAVVGKALESVVQVLLKSVSNQQWGALIRTSTCTVLLLLSRLTWSSTSVFWLPILPKEQIQYAPLSWQFKKTKGPRHLLNVSFQNAKDSASCRPYLTVAVIMCTELPHLRADEKRPAVVQCYYVSTTT